MAGGHYVQQASGVQVTEHLTPNLWEGHCAGLDARTMGAGQAQTGSQPTAH